MAQTVCQPYTFDELLKFSCNEAFARFEQLDFMPDEQSPEKGTLLLSGYVRGRGISVNQLVS
jgi:hypothetical protein